MSDRENQNSNQPDRQKIDKLLQNIDNHTEEIKKNNS